MTPPLLFCSPPPHCGGEKGQEGEEKNRGEHSSELPASQPANQLAAHWLCHQAGILRKDLLPLLLPLLYVREALPAEMKCRDRAASWGNLSTL